MSICRPKTSGGGSFIYQVLASPEGQHKIESLKTGTTGMTMFNISKLRGFDLLWPGDDLVSEYFKIVEPTVKRIAGNDDHSRTVAVVRDTLLPKLISGELRVNDAERVIRERA
jgi:type I restriction enzyme S subunit